MKNISTSILITIFKAVVSIVSNLSNKQIVKFVDFLVVLYTIFPNPSYPQFIANNSVIYPNKSKKEIRELSKKNVFTTLAALVFSLKYSSERYKNNLDLDLEISGKENLKKIKEGSGLICVAPHLGLNTLTVKYFAQTLNRKCLVIMRQSWGNERLETFFREHYGDNMVKVVKLGGTMPEVKKTLDSGGVVLLAVDAMLPIKYKHTVNFFGKSFELSTGPAWLAEKFQSPLITGYGTFDKEKTKIHIHIDTPITLEKTKEKTTEKLAKRLEKYIFDHPGQWFQSDDYFGITGKKHY